VGIVIFSTIIGVILFKEKLSSKNILGIILAILGIVMVTFAS
jgi:drug/metabolite transporter (DMT)-like permease